MKVEGTKTEADKCKLHSVIFQWPQPWTFPRSREGSHFVLVVEEKK
jgi:hypothetical protein